MDLSIIIVNWNSSDYVRKCVASLLAETTGIEFEIVVIDSGSFDGCGEMLRQKFPEVRFVQSRENLGFPRANNLAFEVTTGKCVLFLNPDTELVGPAVNLVYDWLQTIPEAGVVAGTLLNADGTIQTTCIKAFPTLFNQVIEAEALRKLFPRARFWGMAPLFRNSETPAEVDVISGAYMMMRRSVFEAVDRFSTNYFMYSEDVDLCYKARKAGWKNYHIPKAFVVHYGGRSTAQSGVSTFAMVMMCESRWRYFLRTRSAWYAWIYRAGMSGVSVARIGVMLILWPFKSWMPLWGAVVKRWYSCMRWTVGLERWVENF